MVLIWTVLSKFIFFDIYDCQRITSSFLYKLKTRNNAAHATRNIRTAFGNATVNNIQSWFETFRCWEKNWQNNLRRKPPVFVDDGVLRTPSNSVPFERCLQTFLGCAAKPSAIISRIWKRSSSSSNRFRMSWTISRINENLRLRW